jgi:hypothetical protein
LWAAYLVRYKGMEVMDAIAHGKAIEFGSLPFEGFLGGSMKLIIEKP